jgi:hypothetical protein
LKLAGRPINAIRELCREFVFNDQLVQKLADIAKNDSAKPTDRIKAIEVLLDRGYGKAEQSIDLTHHDDTDRPSTDALIQTITALRTELDGLRAGTGVAAKE